LTKSQSPKTRLTASLSIGWHATDINTALAKRKLACGNEQVKHEKKRKSQSTKDPPHRQSSDYLKIHRPPTINGRPSHTYYKGVVGGFVISLILCKQFVVLLETNCLLYS